MSARNLNVSSPASPQPVPVAPKAMPTAISPITTGTPTRRGSATSGPTSAIRQISASIANVMPAS